MQEEIQVLSKWLIKTASNYRNAVLSLSFFPRSLVIFFSGTGVFAIIAKASEILHWLFAYRVFSSVTLSVCCVAGYLYWPSLKTQLQNVSSLAARLSITELFPQCTHNIVQRSSADSAKKKAKPPSHNPADAKRGLSSQPPAVQRKHSFEEFAAEYSDLLNSQGEEDLDCELSGDVEI